MRKWEWGLVALCVLVLSGIAVGQNWQADPLYGTVTLRSGFTPDPQCVAVQAGGANTTADLLEGSDPVTGESPNGYINAERPDVTLMYTSGSFSLRFYVESDVDTTLLVNLPDTTWRCNDDGSCEGYSGLDPVITCNRPQSGKYDIWVGTYSQGRTSPATLCITELMSNHPGS